MVVDEYGQRYGQQRHRNEHLSSVREAKEWWWWTLNGNAPGEDAPKAEQIRSMCRPHAVGLRASPMISAAADTPTRLCL
jgi:hypothetical protein